MLKLKKGDKVKILSGKDRGKEGVVEKVFPKIGKILVEGINIYKKHSKAQIGKKAGIFEIAKPLPVSAIGLICPKCLRSTKIGFKVTATGKFRICKKCGGQI